MWNLLRLINIHSFIQRWHANWNEHDRIISMECATTKKSESYVNAFMLTPLNSISFALLFISFFSTSVLTWLAIAFGFGFGFSLDNLPFISFQISSLSRISLHLCTNVFHFSFTFFITHFTQIEVNFPELVLFVSHFHPIQRKDCSITNNY